MDPVFVGVGVALATLFDEDGEIDVAGHRRPRRQPRRGGIQGVLVSGSTGEAAALTAEERVLLLEGVRDAVPDHIPVLAGTGAPSARQAAALTLSAMEHGADAVLVLSPPRVADPSSYYDIVVRSAGNLPVLAYHFPRASEPGVALEVLPKLPVAGIKDSSGDPDRLLAELDWGKPVYTGRRRSCRSPARSAAPGPSCRWPTSNPRVASPPSPATPPPSAAWPPPTRPAGSTSPGA